MQKTESPSAKTPGSPLGQESVTNPHGEGHKWEPFPKAAGSWVDTSPSPSPFCSRSHGYSHDPSGVHPHSGWQTLPSPSATRFMDPQQGPHHSELCSGSTCSPAPSHWLTGEPLTAHIAAPLAWFMIFPVHVASCPSSGLLGMDQSSTVDILLFSHLQVWLRHIAEAFVCGCEKREDTTVV